MTRLRTLALLSAGALMLPACPKHSPDPATATETDSPDSLPGARTAVTEALALMPGDPMYLCEVGDQDQRQHDWAGAVDVFRKAEATAKRMVEDNDAEASPMGRPPVQWETRALRGIGYSLTELHRLDESKEVYFEILRLDPDDAKAKQELLYIASLQAHPAQ